MNTHDIDIELPPLPPGYKSYEFPDGGYDEDEMRTYALAAIEPYAKRIAQLEAARFAYASEFPLNEDGDPDVGSIHENIRKLKAKLEADRKTTDKQLSAYKRVVNSLEARLAHLQAQHDELKKSTNPDLLASERAANAILTEELEADRKRRGEPVAWQVSNNKIGYWTACRTQDAAEEIAAQHFEAGYKDAVVAPLFIASQPYPPDGWKLVREQDLINLNDSIQGDYFRGLDWERETIKRMATAPQPADPADGLAHQDDPTPEEEEEWQRLERRS